MTKKINWGIILAATLCLAVFYTINYAVDRADLKEVTGTLEKEIEYDDASKTNSIRLQLKETGILYQTGGIGYSACNRVDAQKNLRPGCRITLLVDDRNRFYSLKFGTTYYLRLERYNALQKGRRLVLLIMWSSSF